METIISAFPTSLPSGMKDDTFKVLLDKWNEQVYNAIPDNCRNETTTRNICGKREFASLSKYLGSKINNDNVAQWVKSSKASAPVTMLNKKVDAIAKKFWEDHFVVEASDGTRVRIVDAFLPLVTVNTTKASQLTLTDLQERILKVVHDAQMKAHNDNPKKNPMPLPITQMNNNFASLIALLSTDSDDDAQLGFDKYVKFSNKEDVGCRGAAHVAFTSLQHVSEAYFNRQVLSGLIHEFGGDIAEPLADKEKDKPVYSRDVLCYALWQVAKQLSPGKGLVRETRVKRNTAQSKKQVNECDKSDTDVCDDPQDTVTKPVSRARRVGTK